jgi:hypothetical protein
MKKKKILAIKQDEFLIKLQQYKEGEISENEFCNLLIDEVNYLKIHTIERYKTELENDKKEIQLLTTIKHKIKNNITLEPYEKEVVLSIIG